MLSRKSYWYIFINLLKRRIRIARLASFKAAKRIKYIYIVIKRNIANSGRTIRQIENSV